MLRGPDARRYLQRCSGRIFRMRWRAVSTALGPGVGLWMSARGGTVQ